MNPMLLTTSVQRQAEERLVERWRAKSFSYIGNTVFIAQLQMESDVSELTDECDRFCRYVRRMIGAVVTVGVGHVCKNVLELPQSYSSAKEAVSYRAIFGASRAINIKEIAPQEMNQSGTTNDTELTNLFKVIRMSSAEDIIEAVNKYLDHASFRTKSLQQHHVSVMELVSALYRFAANNDIAMEEYSGDMRNLYSVLLEMEPVALRKWLIDISLSFRVKLISARSRSTKSLVSRAKEYVHNNYSDEELSLDSICKVLNVSNSYFSTIFKKETGDSFIGYLTVYRMERAAQQLVETNEKSYIIARNVGYSDPNYFSYVFKRQYGVSPSKYRTEHAESEK